MLFTLLLLLVQPASSTSFSSSSLLQLFSASSPPPSSLLLFNLSYAYELSAEAGYDELLAVTALQGFLNRLQPTLFVLIEPGDAAWLAREQQPGGWLSATQLLPVGSFLQLPWDRLQGAAVFDPAVPCTSALAQTAAGADDLVPVALRAGSGSVYERLVGSGLLPVALSLVGRFSGNVSGSIKRDAYTWAVDTFLATGRSDAHYLAYYVDSFWTSYQDTPGGWQKATLPNHDFFISKRAFFFDLGVWADEAPVDEPQQPLGSDLAAMRHMLAAAAAQVAQSSSGGLVRIGGFTPWAYKYVAPHGKHGGVEAEWATALVTSAFNAFVDADACCIGNMADASVWMHFPLPSRLVPAPPPQRSQLVQQGLLTPDGSSVVKGVLFYSFYAGDFDSSAWVASQLLQRWQDPVRGSVPIGWPIDPSTAERFPVIWPLLFATASANDTIWSGDSGYGYLNPTALYGATRVAQSGLPDGRPAWVALNTAAYRQLGLSSTGFLITGDAPPMDAEAESIYASFSSNLIVDQAPGCHSPHLTDNTPVVSHWDIDGNVSTAAATLARFCPASASAEPEFHMFRSVLTGPTFLRDVAEAAGSLCSQPQGSAVPLTPLTLGYLMRVHFNGSNDGRVAYIADSLPSTAAAGSQLPFSVTLRNDGWSTLAASALGLLVEVLSSQVQLQLQPEQRHKQRLHRAPSLSALRAQLHRAGFSAEGAAQPGSWSQLFPLPADIEPGATSAPVQAFAALPAARAAGSGSGSGSELLLVTLRYQLVGLASRQPLQGIIPWEAELLVA
jgi:hypothetical protein